MERKLVGTQVSRHHSFDHPFYSRPYTRPWSNFLLLYINQER
jgi:hypothetical protein